MEEEAENFASAFSKQQDKEEWKSRDVRVMTAKKREEEEKEKEKEEKEENKRLCKGKRQHAFANVAILSREIKTIKQGLPAS